MKLFILLVLCMLTVVLNSQDNQWLIKGGLAKTGFDESTQLNIYDSSINNFIKNGHQFSIDSVKHPVQVISAVPRNDLFVIYHDGKYFNSRYLNKGSIYPNAPSNSVAYTISSPYFQTSQIDYFYLTNIYEEDDPPSSIKIGDNVTAPQVIVGNTNPQNSMELNHDLVAGKDVTLVIPKNLINCAVGTTSLSFDTSILSPRPIFGNNSRYSFNDISGLLLNDNKITGITQPINNHFFNFKVKDTVPPSLIGQTAEFTLNCGIDLISSLKDTIRSGHDPNYIKLLCVYKKPTRRQKKYVGVYRVVFMNEGNGIVDSVKVRLKFPLHVNIKQADAYFYYYGGEKGYRSHIDSFITKIDGNYIEFNFKKGFLKSFEDKSINFNRYAKGGIEFQALIDRNPENFSVKLLPEESQVSFDRVSQKFDFFYDLKKEIPKKCKGKRRIAKIVCDCPTAVKPKDCK